MSNATTNQAHKGPEIKNICKFSLFAPGCMAGSACPYFHPTHPELAAVEVAKKNTTGVCGFFTKGKCSRSDCKFLHVTVIGLPPASPASLAPSAHAPPTERKQGKDRRGKRGGAPAAHPLVRAAGRAQRIADQSCAKLKLAQQYAAAMPNSAVVDEVAKIEALLLEACKLLTEHNDRLVDALGKIGQKVTEEDEGDEGESETSSVTE